MPPHAVKEELQQSMKATASAYVASDPDSTIEPEEANEENQ
jgi:hypothetical protein